MKFNFISILCILSIKTATVSTRVRMNLGIHIPSINLRLPMFHLPKLKLEAVIHPLPRYHRHHNGITLPAISLTAHAHPDSNEDDDHHGHHQPPSPPPPPPSPPAPQHPQHPPQQHEHHTKFSEEIEHMLAGFENNSDFDYSFPSSQSHSHFGNRSIQNPGSYGYPFPFSSHHQFRVGGSNVPKPIGYSSMSYQQEQEQNSLVAEHVSPPTQNSLEHDKGVKGPHGNLHPPYSSSPISPTPQAPTAFQYTSHFSQLTPGGNQNSYQQQIPGIQQMKTNDVISSAQKGSSHNPSYQSFTPGNISPPYSSPVLSPVASQKSWYRPLISEGMKKLLNSHLSIDADKQHRPKQSYQLLQSLLSRPASSSVNH
ncbi:uncharacterized protein LOC141853242 [Brevipalpus obovatus]|uniref:uncharacterized protein LOC141853242 n=1 Tax=Brevipalpus obovatus TaxID=246614 RepID=UPI003D9E6716